MKWLSDMLPKTKIVLIIVVGIVLVAAMYFGVLVDILTVILGK